MRRVETKKREREGGKQGEKERECGDFKKHQTPTIELE
jgi:hypothetical protein